MAKRTLSDSDNEIRTRARTDEVLFSLAQCRDEEVRFAFDMYKLFLPFPKEILKKLLYWICRLLVRDKMTANSAYENARPGTFEDWHSGKVPYKAAKFTICPPSVTTDSISSKSLQDTHAYWHRFFSNVWQMCVAHSSFANLNQGFWDDFNDMAFRIFGNVPFYLLQNPPTPNFKGTSIHVQLPRVFITVTNSRKEQEKFVMPSDPNQIVDIWACSEDDAFDGEMWSFLDMDWDFEAKTVDTVRGTGNNPRLTSLERDTDNSLLKKKTWFFGRDASGNIFIKYSFPKEFITPLGDFSGEAKTLDDVAKLELVDLTNQ